MDKSIAKGVLRLESVYENTPQENLWFNSVKISP